MSLTIKLWKIVGLLAYYAMFLSVGATYGIIAFLFGFVFGEFWANLRNQTNRIADLDVPLEIYFATAFPLFIIVWSTTYLATSTGASTLQPTLKLYLSIATVLLFYFSYYFRVKVLSAEDVIRRRRWCITFGPIVGGGLTATAGFCLAIESYGDISESLWWISLALLVISLVPIMTSIIFLVLLSLERPTAQPLPPQKTIG